MNDHVRLIVNLFGYYRLSSSPAVKLKVKMEWFIFQLKLIDH